MYNPTSVHSTAQYQAYVFDVMGTTVPKAHLNDIYDYLTNSPTAHKAIGERFGYTPDQIRDIADKGSKAGKEGNKDSTEFKQYLKIADFASATGYESGELQMDLEGDVEATIKRIKDAGGRIAIFSSGSVENSRKGMQGNGLDKYIDTYLSSDQPEIGTKVRAEGYLAVARALGISPDEMCYVNDLVKEADAAVDAGVGAVYVIDRSGKLESKAGYTVIDNLEQIADDTLEADNTEGAVEAAEASE